MSGLFERRRVTRETVQVQAAAIQVHVVRGECLFVLPSTIEGSCSVVLSPTPGGSCVSLRLTAGGPAGITQQPLDLAVKLFGVFEAL